MPGLPLKKTIIYRSQQWTQNQKQLSTTPEEQKLLDDCRGKPFWVTKHNEKKDCCFNCIIGWPRKDELEANNVEHPIYDYEIAITNDIESHQHVWIKKSRGLGITEIILRYLAWCCLSSDYYKNKFIHIIAGTREDFANKLIVRLENIFQHKYPDVRFQSKYTELWLNKTLVQIYPSKQLKDLRGHIDVSFMFIDEADYFDRAEQEELPFVIKSYEEKSNAKVLMVSTPNRPDGLFYEIETDKKFKGFFHKLQLGYDVGLDKIYNRKFIEREKLEPEFEREYNLKYLGKIGNVFHYQDIDHSIVEYDLAIKEGQSMGIDPGFGGSAFGVVITYYQDGKIHILLAEDFDRPSHEEMREKCWQLIKKYNIKKIYVDGSALSFIRSLKIMIGERSNYETIPKEHYRFMRVQPINFATRHKEMLGYAKSVLEADFIRIHPTQQKLIIALKTAWEDNGSLSKEQTSHDDVFDAFRLSLLAYKQGEHQQAS